MTWGLVIYTVVALVVLLLVAGPSRRRRRPPEGHWVRVTRPTYEMAYKNGFRAGYRAGQAEPSLPPALWQHMLVLVHPDHHEGSSLHPMAAEVTRWLLMHRPRASAEMNQWGNRPVCVEQSRSAPMPAMPRRNANSYWPRSDTALDRLHS